jgi:hypothetical protein
MASEFCKIPPTNDTQSIISQLPTLPGINQIVDLINAEVNKLKLKYLGKIKEMLSNFAEGICPTQPQIDKFVGIRNNIVESLIKVYEKVDRLSNNISGVTNFLTLILTGIKVASGVARSLALGTIFSPFPIPGAISSGISAAQGEIEKFKFKADGAQKLVPITGGLISANIAVKLFASALRELICTIEALDASMIECASQPPVDTPPEKVNEVKLELAREFETQLTPISPAIISFIEQDVEEQDSLLETTYRGFNFEIEEIPFSPTVNRRRALAKNSDGITLLQSELSFTSTPTILIEELKFVIDRDNLRAQ